MPSPPRLDLPLPMSDFILYRKGYKYQLSSGHITVIPIHPAQLVKNDWIQLYPNGLLCINSGYAWDGPSGPALDTPSAMRGSLIHDALYQLIRQGHLSPTLRATADQIYKDTCLADGMFPLRAWAHFRATQLFGSPSANPSSERPILTAP